MPLICYACRGRGSVYEEGADGKSSRTSCWHCGGTQAAEIISQHPAPRHQPAEPTPLPLNNSGLQYVRIETHADRVIVVNTTSGKPEFTFEFTDTKPASQVWEDAEIAAWRLDGCYADAAMRARYY